MAAVVRASTSSMFALTRGDIRDHKKLDAAVLAPPCLRLVLRTGKRCTEAVRRHTVLGDAEAFEVLSDGLGARER